MKSIEDTIQTIFENVIRRELKDFLENVIAHEITNHIRGDPLETLSTDKVCELLHVSKPTVRRLIKSKELPVIRLGSGKRAPLRIRRTDLQKFLSK